MNKKIIISGLNYNYNKQVAKHLADGLDMFFLDVNDYLNYNLYKRQDMLDKCGLDYLEMQETNAIRACSEFEHTVINFPFVYYQRNNAYKMFKGEFISFYIRFDEPELKNISEIKDKSEKLTIDIISFSDRDKILKKICNYFVDAKFKTEVDVATEIEHIMSKIKA